MNIIAGETMPIVRPSFRVLASRFLRKKKKAKRKTVQRKKPKYEFVPEKGGTKVGLRPKPKKKQKT